MTLISRLADPQQQAETFTWVSLATVTGDAVGQQTAGLLVDPLGARTVFPVAAGLCLAAMAAAFAFRGRFAHPTAPNAHARESERPHSRDCRGRRRRSGKQEEQK
ncbi:hypothetical protein E4K10_46220 [Streptomyces sp. T1317-0309]|nr:hypothetical protein E4K10_46220 [Streptomyces sp. T1317-0309]